MVKVQYLHKYLHGAGTVPSPVPYTMQIFFPIVWNLVQLKQSGRIVLVGRIVEVLGQSVSLTYLDFDSDDIGTDVGRGQPRLEKACGGPRIMPITESSETSREWNQSGRIKVACGGYSFNERH